MRLSAPETGSLVVTVVDRDGVPMPDVMVNLMLTVPERETGDIGEIAIARATGR